MYKINRDVFHRAGSLLGAMVFMAGLGTSLLPSLASADALNPLTERSLALSSSSPGWAYTDGSGNATYAFPNSGQNGQKSGETFTFRVSSTQNIKAFTFQYCTTPAGKCLAPGDGTGAGQSDFNVTAGTTTHAPALITSTNWDAIKTRTEGTLGSGQHAQLPKADDSEGTFVVLTAPANAPLTNGVPTYSYPTWDDDADSGTPEVPVEDWTFATKNQEEATVGTPTGKNNFITLSSATGVNLNFNDYVKVVFFATDENYITNPGSGAFFAKLNDYKDATTLTEANLVDGGVTVANVMNESIAIQTKVLETMDFSVGTVDPDTLTVAEYSTATAGAKTAHGQCSPILTGLAPSDPHNVLLMGDTDSENSLSTTKTYATHSYWRLSSNSSGGATVYYAGNTLANTVGDVINPSPEAGAAPATGTEQFGLAIDNQTTGNRLVNYVANTSLLESGADKTSSTKGALDNDPTSGWAWYLANTGAGVAHDPQLAPLAPVAAYANGGGNFDSSQGTINTVFAFDNEANTVPVPIATEGDQVVDCVTAKMRYIANIAATTPAGIYTTKINYIASPQY